MFKDGFFFRMLVQSGTMLHFPGYISSSRWSLDNLFTPFERTYVGVVFDTKISVGNHYVFPGERLKNTSNRLFLRRALENLDHLQTSRKLTKSL